MHSKWAICVLAAVMAVAAPRRGDASPFLVTLDTAPLQASAGPFSLFFQLTDGSGSVPGDGNNTVSVSNFVLGGGSIGLGAAPLSGGASGGVTEGFTLNDADFLNSVTLDFTPGTTLSFLLSMTTYADVGGTPDAFAFSILPVATEDWMGGTLLTVNLDGSETTFLTYGANLESGVALQAPTVTPVPEPATLVLLGSGLAAVCGCGRRRR